MKAIWDGRGDADGMVYFTKDNGEIVGRDYVRTRVAQHLARFRHYHTLTSRQAALESTVGNDEWLAYRNLSTVSSLCRDAAQALLDS